MWKINEKRVLLGIISSKNPLYVIGFNKDNNELNKIKVIYDEPQKNIVPGQSAVFYESQIVIGGGKID